GQVPALAETLYIQGSNRRDGIDIALSADMASKTLAVSVVAPSIETQTLEFAVDGPDGTRITVQGLLVSGREDPAQLYSSGEGTHLTLYSTSNYSSAQAFTIGSGSSGSSSSASGNNGPGDPNCGCVPYEIVQLQQQFFPGFCRQFPPMTSCPTEGGG